MRGPTTDEIYEALSEVIDPELGIDIVSLGLVYEVGVEAPVVEITFTLTTPACPLGELITSEIIESVGVLPGVGEVRATLVWKPVWSPEMMSEDAKFALGFAF